MVYVPLGSVAWARNAGIRAMRAKALPTGCPHSIIRRRAYVYRS
jgi:hypothetical protein